MGLRDEIFEQPGVMQRWLDTQLDRVAGIAASIAEREVEYVFLAARGSSDHAGVYAQYLFGTRNRLPVALAAPSLFTMYHQSPRLRKALVIGISQSGQSPDIVNVLAEGRRQGAITLAITNDSDSPLAQASEITLVLNAGQERAVAATKTYTAELLALATLSVAMAGNKGDDLRELARIPEIAHSMLSLDTEVEQLAGDYRSMTHCVVLGRGYNYATALEWALKLKELAYVFTDVYSTADFQHGPIAILHPRFPVLAIAPVGAVFADQLKLLARLRNDYQAELLIISDNDDALSLAHKGLRLTSTLAEWLSPITSIIPLQLFCYHLTLAKGYNPENPRTLRKVTVTE